MEPSNRLALLRNSNSGNGLHVLQAKFDRHQETKWRSMFHRERLTA
jgi:hypothetical protein